MIKSIRLINFKCFMDNVLEFRKITVFAGENASGKSSAIQSLLLLAQISENTSTIENVSINTNYLSSSENYITGELQLNDIYNMHLGSFKEIRNSRATNDSIYFEVSTLDNNAESITKIEAREIANTVKYIVNQNDEKYQLTSSPIKYLYAERIGPRTTQIINTKKNMFVGYQGEFVNQIIIDKFDDRVLDELLIQQRINREVKDIFLGKQVQHWLNYITPGIELYPEDYGKLYMTSMGIKRKGFTEDFLNPYNIGFGVTYVLPIIVNCLISKPDDVIIIENPEAHLHPRAQSHLGIFLCQVAAAGIQVILETHSDHVVDGIRRASVDGIIDPKDTLVNFHSVSLGNGMQIIKVNPMNIDDNGEIDYWPDGFMSQKSNDMSEILKSRMSRRRDK